MFVFPALYGDMVARALGTVRNEQFQTAEELKTILFTVFRQSFALVCRGLLFYLWSLGSVL